MCQVLNLKFGVFEFAMRTIIYNRKSARTFFVENRMFYKFDNNYFYNITNRLRDIREKLTFVTFDP